MTSKIRTKVAAAVLAGASIATMQSSSASANTADYIYECISPAGQGYLLKPGSPLSNCKGSYLNAYISGRKAWSMNLTSAGTPARGLTRADANCVIAIVSGVYSIYTTKGAALWASGGFSVWGVVSSCRA